MVDLAMRRIVQAIKGLIKLLGDSFWPLRWVFLAIRIVVADLTMRRVVLGNERVLLAVRSVDLAMRRVVQATSGVDLATGRVVSGNERVLLAIRSVDLAIGRIVQATKGVDLATGRVVFSSALFFYKNMFYKSIIEAQKSAKITNIQRMS